MYAKVCISETFITKDVSRMTFERVTKIPLKKFEKLVI